MVQIHFSLYFELTLYTHSSVRCSFQLWARLRFGRRTRGEIWNSKESGAAPAKRLEQEQARRVVLGGNDSGPDQVQVSTDWPQLKSGQRGEVHGRCQIGPCAMARELFSRFGRERRRPLPACVPACLCACHTTLRTKQSLSK